jgi:uracil-DNA glycosylase
LATLEDFKVSLGDWRKPLKSAVDTFTFEALYKYVKAEYTKGTCYPPRELIFNAFKTATFAKLKVVIVG